MRNFDRAIDVIPASLPVIAIFTKGDKLSFNKHGNGETGNWKVDPCRIKKINKLIIYLRGPQESGGRIFIATIIGTRPSSQSRRQVIQFDQLEEIGKTESDWPKFADTHQTPVRYLNVRAI